MSLVCSDLAPLGERLRVPRHSPRARLAAICRKTSAARHRGTSLRGAVLRHKGHLKPLYVSTCHTERWHVLMQGCMLADLSADTSLSAQTDANLPPSWEGERSTCDVCRQQVQESCIKQRFFYFTFLLTLHNSSEKLSPAGAGCFLCLPSSRPKQNEKALDSILAA